jgi:hypothetical protein
MSQVSLLLYYVQFPNQNVALSFFFFHACYILCHSHPCLDHSNYEAIIMHVSPVPWYLSPTCITEMLPDPIAGYETYKWANSGTHRDGRYRERNTNVCGIHLAATGYSHPRSNVSGIWLMQPQHTSRSGQFLTSEEEGLRWEHWNTDLQWQENHFSKTCSHTHFTKQWQAVTAVYNCHCTSLRNTALMCSDKDITSTPLQTDLRDKAGYSATSLWHCTCILFFLQQMAALCPSASAFDKGMHVWEPPTWVTIHRCQLLCNGLLISFPW